MDIAILCGGYGTRLLGLWDGPKCLVPLGDGRPILWHLLVRAHALRPRRIHLITGHKGAAVAMALREWSMRSPKLHVLREAEPAGTATGVRRIAYTTEPPLMVINGDTLPLYDLADLAKAWKAAQPDVLTAWCGGLQAGARIFSSNALEKLGASKEPDLDTLIEREYFGAALRVCVKGFLDIGTPHGFELGCRWKEVA